MVIISKQKFESLKKQVFHIELWPNILQSLRIKYTFPETIDRAGGWEESEAKRTWEGEEINVYTNRGK